MSFYGSNDLTNSVKALKEDRFQGSGLIPSGPPTVLTIIQHICSIKQKH